MRISHKIVVTICSDNLEENTLPETDIFFANKQTAKRILQIARQENITIEEPICIQKQNQKIRFETKELTHLAQNISVPIYRKYEGEVKNLSVFLANNPYSEIEQVAINITKLVKQGYRYEQMAVITKNISDYSSICKVIFANYHIPVFIDEKRDLSNNPLAKFILALLEIFAKNWSYEAVFGYCKTGLLEIENDKIAILENYCIKWGIKGSKWYLKQWKFYDETQDEIQSILYAKDKIVQPLMNLKKQLQGLKTVDEITRAIYQFLLENKIFEKLKEKIEELINLNELEKAKEYELSMQIIIDLLDEIILVLGKENITFDKYIKILKMGFKQNDLGLIPEAADQIIVGDIDRSRSHKVKIAFLIGLNDGKFPSIQKEEGFLDDEDREKLKEKGIELAKNSIEQLYDENFNIYKAFTTAEEKLYLSYVSSNSEGKSLRPSMSINKIKRIFPNLKEQSDIIGRKSEILLENTTFDELLIQLRNWQEEKQIEPIWFEVYHYYQKAKPQQLENALKALHYQNKPEKLNTANLQKLYGNTLKTSISRLENYQACAFSYYLKYGLKLKEKSRFQVETIDTGNFMHDVIDNFFEKLEENSLNIKLLQDDMIKTITEEVVEELLQKKQYDIFSSIPKYRILAMRLKKVIVKSMKYIVDSIKYSEFDVVGHEIEFKEGKQLKPIILKLKNGKTVEITGKIDRLDIAKTKERKLHKNYRL